MGPTARYNTHLIPFISLPSRLAFWVKSYGMIRCGSGDPTRAAWVLISTNSGLWRLSSKWLEQGKRVTQGGRCISYIGVLKEKEAANIWPISNSEICMSPGLHRWFGLGVRLVKETRSPIQVFPTLKTSHPQIKQVYRSKLIVMGIRHNVCFITKFQV